MLICVQKHKLSTHVHVVLNSFCANAAAVVVVAAANTHTLFEHVFEQFKRREGGRGDYTYTNDFVNRSTNLPLSLFLSLPLSSSTLFLLSPFAPNFDTSYVDSSNSRARVCA